VAALDLGRLLPGHYDDRVTVTGPDWKKSFATRFEVKAGKK